LPPLSFTQDIRLDLAYNEITLDGLSTQLAHR
jgi:hypothetical protein